jgi:enterochelin esterase family protein
MTPKTSCGISLVSLLGLVLWISAALAAQQAQDEFVIKPPYVPAPELTAKDGVPKGTLHRLIMKSEDSKIYPGISRDKPGAVVPYERVVNVYVPAQYRPGTPAPFIVVQDGDSPRYRDPLP